MSGAVALVSRRWESPVGELRLVASDEALVAVLWPADTGKRVPFDAEPVDGSNSVIECAIDQLREYFDGTRTQFSVPLAPQGTDFQRAVWRALVDIPLGETSTYGALAQTLGRPQGAQAVGAANGRNPISVVIPCHRIIGSDGSLTGFAGGLGAKRWLLAHERKVAGVGQMELI